MSDFSRRAFLFGAAALPLVCALPAFGSPRRIEITDLRVGDKFTIAGVHAVDPVSGLPQRRLQQFTIIETGIGTARLSANV